MIYKSKIAILDNAHLKVQTLCYFMIKSDLPNGDKITSVWDNAIFFPAIYSLLFVLISSAETYFFQQQQTTAATTTTTTKERKNTWFSHALSQIYTMLMCKLFLHVSFFYFFYLLYSLQTTKSLGTRHNPMTHMLF